jgi:hypothetical protein
VPKGSDISHLSRVTLRDKQSVKGARANMRQPAKNPRERGARIIGHATKRADDLSQMSEPVRFRRYALVLLAQVDENANNRGAVKAPEDKLSLDVN